MKCKTDVIKAKPERSAILNVSGHVIAGFERCLGLKNVFEKVLKR